MSIYSSLAKKGSHLKSIFSRPEVIRGSPSARPRLQQQLAAGRSPLGPLDPLAVDDFLFAVGVAVADGVDLAQRQGRPLRRLSPRPRGPLMDELYVCS